MVAEKKSDKNASVLLIMVYLTGTHLVSVSSLVDGRLACFQYCQYCQCDYYVLL